MANGKSRVVIDTNLWISLLLTGRPEKLLSYIDSEIFTLVFSPELLNELLEVIQRPKFNGLISSDLLADLLFFLEQKAEFVQVTSSVDLCRDKKDNFLLALCKDGQADVLITGDADLLTLHPFENTHILKWSAFESSVS